MRIDAVWKFILRRGNPAKKTPHRPWRTSPSLNVQVRNQCERDALRNPSDCQVLFHDVVVQMGDGAFGDDCAAIHDVEVVPDIEAEVEVLLDEENPDLPFLAQE